MLSFTHSKGECTGCSACMAACPIDCITMQIDEEGFWYPVSSDACINCGKCEKVCPIPKHEATANIYEQKAYACLSKDDAIWRRSASGGAFSEICLAWGDDKTIVVGAAWDGMDVHHICVEGVDNISSLCKSKYVASHPEKTLSEIKAYLKEGKKVIYCGTPCQVAGLKSFLVKPYNNLLTIDLICHGVGSRTVFKHAVMKMENQLGASIGHYEFRAKRSKYETDYISSLQSDKGLLYVSNDPYIQLFLSQNALRPSCGKNCVFRDSKRQGDLTIADFKGLLEVFPELFGTKRNYTAIVTNSVKGESVVEKLAITTEIHQTDVSNVARFNPLFEKNTWFSNDRDSFFADFTKDPEEALNKWTVNYQLFRPSAKRTVYNLLPSSLLRILKRIL